MWGSSQFTDSSASFGASSGSKAKKGSGVVQGNSTSYKLGPIIGLGTYGEVCA